MDRDREANKSSFLHLFSDFYDALADSKLLKGWLQEQLTRSGKLVDVLEEQAKKGGVNPSAADDHSASSSGAGMEEMLEKKLGPLKNELEGLRKRVGELEEALYWERVEREKERKVQQRDASHSHSQSKRVGSDLHVATGKGKDLEREEMDVDEDKDGGSGVKVSTSAVRLEPGVGAGERDGEKAIVNGEDGKSGGNGNREGGKSA